jgi:hypothetical protein
MENLKVGDRVRVIGKDYKLFKNEVGTVKTVHYSYIIVKLDNFDYLTLFYESDLEINYNKYHTELADYISKRPYTSSSLPNIIQEWLTSNKLYITHNEGVH